MRRKVFGVFDRLHEQTRTWVSDREHGSETKGYVNINAVPNARLMCTVAGSQQDIWIERRASSVIGCMLKERPKASDLLQQEWTQWIQLLANTMCRRQSTHSQGP